MDYNVANMLCCEDRILLIAVNIFGQVLPLAQSLNSSDVFLIHSSSICYLWVGKGSIGDEREVAREAARLIWHSDDPERAMEGDERNGWCESLNSFKSSREQFIKLHVVYQARETVFHPDIQTPRRELNIQRAAEYF